MGVSEIVVKQGGQGCLIRTGGDIVEVPADRNENAVDTSAAGDSFNAGYIAARMAAKTTGPSRCRRAPPRRHGYLLSRRHYPPAKPCPHNHLD